jgi:type IV secretory pathway VirJ component
MRKLSMLTVAIAATLGGTFATPAQGQAHTDTTDVRDLPIIEVPAHTDGPMLAILLSGDGGWASIDRQIADELASHGVSVVGFNLKDYLGKERTPAETSVDVARAIRAYRHKWNRGEIVIVGFSRGANIAPFAVARFPDDLRADVKLMALIGLAQAANFKWHWQDVVRDVKRSSDVPVRPELDKLTSLRTICIFGTDEKESGCRNTPAEVTRVERAGGHHMDGDYKAVADIVLDALKR